jgi:nucleotide-binding universal stress UspA family protein
MKTLNIQNIIVPVDFSKMSDRVIQISKQLARRFGASIHLVHVHEFIYAADFVGLTSAVIPFLFVGTHNRMEGRRS